MSQEQNMTEARKFKNCLWSSNVSIARKYVSRLWFLIFKAWAKKVKKEAVCLMSFFKKVNISCILKIEEDKAGWTVFVGLLTS